MSKIALEMHSFEKCYTNPLSPDFKPNTYWRCMLYLIHNRIEILSYMQPSLLKPADAQHCCAELFMAYSRWCNPSRQGWVKLRWKTSN